MKKLSFTMENYLEAIYELSGGSSNSGVRVSDISERLGVTKPASTVPCPPWPKRGCVINERYKEVFLTPAGLERAKMTSKKHQIIQKFFTDILKIDAGDRRQRRLFHEACHQRRFRPRHGRIYGGK